MATCQWKIANLLGYIAGFCQPRLHIVLHLIRDDA
jgi:hypothetical protein